MNTKRLAVLDTIRLAFLGRYGPTVGKLQFEHGLAITDAASQNRYCEFWLGDTPPPRVDVETFARDEIYWGMGTELYPALVAHLVELNSGKYVEAVLTGGIGCAKTTLGQITCAYQLYLLSLIPDPHAVFGLERESEIVFIFQNITQNLAETVDYARFKNRILKCPYFCRWFPPNISIGSELRFPNNIVVKPVSGSSLAAIGQNVIGGLIDELNYMAVTAQSKKSMDQGVFNQAVEIYNSVARRRKSRFYKQGVMPGVLCLASSKRYPGQFTDKKMEEREAEIAEKGTSSIYLYDMRVWDLKPEHFSHEYFRVFTGDESRTPRILAKLETVPERDAKHLIEVPVDFRKEFEDDIVNALREIAGISHVTRSPFFTNPELLAKIFTERPSVFSCDAVDFVEGQLRIMRGAIKDPDLPRFAHVDLAATGDSAGVAICYCPGFVSVPRGDAREVLPIIVYDGVLEVRPPKGGEIQFERIRHIFYWLRDKCGMNVKWISFDGWQSRDSIQQLQRQGFITGVQSMDKTTDPAVMFKAAVNDGRVDCPQNAKLHRELRELQINYIDEKVDHLPSGSKDLSDAVMGACYGLARQRKVWVMHGVSLSSVPPSMAQLSETRRRNR